MLRKRSHSRGEALAVDRDVFASEVERRLSETGHVTVVREEVPAVPEDGTAIIATGPSHRCACRGYLPAHRRRPPVLLRCRGPHCGCGKHRLGPLLSRITVRPGDGDYVNCPLAEDEYAAIWEAIRSAETVPLHDFEDPRFSRDASLWRRLRLVGGRRWP